MGRMKKWNLFSEFYLLYKHTDMLWIDGLDIITRLSLLKLSTPVHPLDPIPSWIMGSKRCLVNYLHLKGDWLQLQDITLLAYSLNIWLIVEMLELKACYQVRTSGRRSGRRRLNELNFAFIEMHTTVPDVVQQIQFKSFL